MPDLPQYRKPSSDDAENRSTPGTPRTWTVIGLIVLVLVVLFVVMHLLGARPPH